MDNKCWICLSSENIPFCFDSCKCVGELGCVHDECINKWKCRNPVCRVCLEPYKNGPKLNKVKEKALLVAQITLGVCAIVAPYIAGPIIALNHKRFEDIGWL